MKKNIWKLFVIIALAAVIGLGLTGCPTDSDDGGGSGGGGGGGGGGGNPTIKLEDKGNNTFTLTLSGATYDPQYSDGVLANQIGSMDNFETTGSVGTFTLKKTSDTVVTVTVTPTGQSGTIKLRVRDGQHADVYGTAGSLINATLKEEVEQLNVASDSGTANVS
jgi:hypothetical protein